MPINQKRFDELDTMKYADLKKMGGKLGLKYLEMRVKKPILINNIIAKEDKWPI